MCENIIVLYFFMILKIIILFILPLIILIKRKKNYSKVLIIIDIILLLFLLICNTFTINKCVYNSTTKGIEKTKIGNKLNLYNNLHPEVNIATSYNINPELNYKTYNGKNLYYYNINRNYMKDTYYECGEEKIYINSFGSAITSYSIAISTLYDSNINPVQVFNYYKQENLDLCNKLITIDNIHEAIMKVYTGITISQIGSSQISASLSNGGLVIAMLSANEESKLTCDTSYIVIYNVDLEGKYKIADSSLQGSSYACSSTSKAYGNVINSDNMNKSWTLEEIENEAVRYYLVKKG